MSEQGSVGCSLGASRGNNMEGLAGDWCDIEVRDFDNRRGDQCIIQLAAYYRSGQFTRECGNHLDLQVRILRAHRIKHAWQEMVYAGRNKADRHRARGLRAAGLEL